MIDDRPDLSERYARAIGSHNLKVKSTRCDVDLLIASGWTRETLGTALYRLRTEFDAVRGEYRQMLRHLGQARDETDIARAVLRAGPPEAPMAKAIARGAEAERQAVTTVALILIRLKTLPQARDAIGQFACAHATRQRFMRPDREVCEIAGRALQLWLDDVCPSCDGRGTVHTFGSAPILCSACGGSGRRRSTLAPDEAGHDFGMGLVNQIHRKAAHASCRMAELLANWQRFQADPEAHHDIHKRLFDLRSSAAQED